MNRMSVGVLLLRSELEWDGYNCGQSKSSTVINVDKVRVRQLLLWKSKSGTGIIVDRLRVGQLLLWTV